MGILSYIGSMQLFLMVIFLVVLLLPLIALIDILKSEFTGSNKIIWVLLVILLPIVGLILYFTIGKEQKIK